MRKITKLYKGLLADSLYQNSIYLMLASGAMAVFGFFFWLICAHLYPTYQVGIATTIISIVGLISSFSLLGLGNGLIKYLPRTEKKSEIMNTSLALVAGASLSISFLFLMFLKPLSPELLFLKKNFLYALFFVIFTVVFSLNTLVESIFIAYRSSKYIFIKNSFSSATRLVIPYFFVFLGAYGIFAAYGAGIAMALAIASFYITVKFAHRFKLVINGEVVRKIMRFSVGNYIAGFIGNLPAMALPIFITNSIGAKFSAYFYVDMMIASLLFIIPYATTQSLFAEGSNGESGLKSHLAKTIKIITLTLIPAIIFTVFLGKYILLIFGREYSEQGHVFLEMLALSGIFISINSVACALFCVKHRIKLFILVNSVTASVIMVLSVLLIRQGLLGIGAAWLIGQAATAALCIPLMKRLI
jgi:O-antigen/teichoic acid export membrane protein